MALDATQVRTAPSGHIYVAPTGTLEPTDVTTALDPGFVELGYVTEDGVTIAPNVEQEDLMVWQSLMPVLSPITSVVVEVSLVLAQYNRDTFSVFFLGGDWTDDGTTARLDLKSNPGTQERALVVEWDDNTSETYRLVVPRAQMTEREELTLVRGELSGLGVTFKALDDSGLAAYLLTNNDEFVVASS